MKYKVIAVICCIALCVAAFSGCGWLSQLREWKSGGAATETEPLRIEQPLRELPGPEGATDPTPSEKTAELLPPDTPMREVVLYFASADGESLEAEIRSVPKQEGIARATVNQLIAGPKQNDLLPTIPAATILEDINIRDGVCIVDFSEELSADHPGGLRNEQLTVYSIVNTLSQFDSISQVRILVDGQAVESLAGHVDVSEAMAPYEALIK